jgi:hypothetical protein
VYLRVLCSEFLDENFTTEDTGVHRGKFFRGSLGNLEASAPITEMKGGVWKLRRIRTIGLVLLVMRSQ